MINSQNLIYTNILDLTYNSPHFLFLKVTTFKAIVRRFDPGDCKRIWVVKRALYWLTQRCG